MIKTLMTRYYQGYKTIQFPEKEPILSQRFRGLPQVNQASCSASCSQCTGVCPTGALSNEPPLSIDMGKCIFCTSCTKACPLQCIVFTNDYKLACSQRKDLICGTQSFIPTASLHSKLRKIFKRSLKLRQVSAGGCNACEADINVLSTIVFDLGRFGIQIVASPRHADGIIVTGPVTENMRIGLLKTYEATPDPKLVIAAGTCAISGGIFQNQPEQHNGVDSVLPVDIFIPGCPPHPLTILDGLLRALGKI